MTGIHPMPMEMMPSTIEAVAIGFRPTGALDAAWICGAAVGALGRDPAGSTKRSPLVETSAVQARPLW